MTGWQPRWEDEDDFLLTKLWNEGHRTTDIGKQMGRTKNSIVGRAHRLRLPPRPSPIKYAKGPSLRAIGRRAPPKPIMDIPRWKARKNPSAELLPEQRMLYQRLRQRGIDKETALSEARANSLAMLATPYPERRGMRADYSDLPESKRQCAYPIGHPDQPDFHFCDKKAVGNKSYCAEHCARTLIKVGTTNHKPQGEVDGKGFEVRQVQAEG